MNGPAWDRVVELLPVARSVARRAAAGPPGFDDRAYDGALDGLIEAARTWPDLEGERFLIFARACMRSRQVDQVRRANTRKRGRGWRPVGLGDPGEHGYRELAAPEPGPILPPIEDMVAGLPDLERDVLLLRFRDDVPTRKIACMFGVSARTVERVIASGLRRLAPRFR